MVDAVLAETRRTQRRVRDLPSRVVVYLLLAGCLFAEQGYRQVWQRLVGALDGQPVADPSSAALTKARRRVGPRPLRALARRSESGRGEPGRGQVIVPVAGPAAERSLTAHTSSNRTLMCAPSALPAKQCANGCQIRMSSSVVWRSLLPPWKDVNAQESSTLGAAWLLPSCRADATE